MNEYLSLIKGGRDISQYLPLVQHFIQKEEIIIPSSIFNEKIIEELETSLEAGTVFSIKNFFNKISKNIDDYLDKETFTKFLHNIFKNNELLDEEFGLLLTSDDFKIIDFLCDKTVTTIEDFLEISGPLFFISEIIDELNTSKESVSDSIRVTTLLYIYVNSIELILHIIDRRLVNHLEEGLNKSQKKKNPYRKFLHFNRETQHEHATMGAIYNVLNKLIDLGNDSIFEMHSESRTMRNRISHSNLFYDSNKMMLVTLSGEEISLDQFNKNFYRQYSFLIKWLETTIDVPLDATDLYSLLREEIRNNYINISKYYQKFQRAGLKYFYGNYILSVKKEVKTR